MCCLLIRRTFRRFLICRNLQAFMALESVLSNKKVLVVDNYDSFVFNIVHYIEDAGIKHITVRENDEISLAEINGYDKILLSPGPGLPKDAGMMPEIIKNFADKKSILGICLGHQAIGEAFGATLKNLDIPLHGLSSEFTMSEADYLFNGLPHRFKIAHYHSWVIHNQLPQGLEALGFDEAGNIMAIRHKTYDVRGVQFHPESVMTEHGKTIIGNWLNS